MKRQLERQQQRQQQRQQLSIFYDGDCPVCSRYVMHTRLRESLDLSLTDLRAHPEAVSRFNAQGLNVDEGMIVVLDGVTYHGAAAMHVLALLATPAGLFNRFNRLVFSRRWLARLLYPLLVAGRNLLLWILGREKINAQRE